MLRVRTARTFSTSQPPKVLRPRQFLTLLTWKYAFGHNGVRIFRRVNFQKVVRTWCVLYMLTWKRASRHKGVLFLISHLATWLRTRRFSEPTFRCSGAANMWRNAVNRDCPTCRAPASSVFSIFLFSDLLTSFLLLSDFSHLCFSICPYCRKFDFQTSFGCSACVEYPILKKSIPLLTKNDAQYFWKWLSSQS